MSADRAILIRNATLLRPGSDQAVIERGAVLVRGDSIAWVGPEREYPSGLHADERLDAGGCVVMPGFVNAHMHFYSTFACGLAPEPAANFTEILEHLWWRLDKSLGLDDVEASAWMPVIRAIQSGTTTVIDHHASPFAVEGSLDAIAGVTRKAGIRAALCYEVSDRDGPEIAAAGIAENGRFAESLKAQPDQMLAGMMGLHAAFTVGPQTLERAVAEARRLGIGCHVHTAEDLSDQNRNLDEYGKRVVTRLADAGAFGPKSIAAHCVHVDEAERERLQETGVFVVHNPQSNMNNAVGAADLPDLYARGIRLGLGTDGMTSDMRQEVRIAMLIHRHVTGDPGATFVEPLEMLLVNNAAFASELFGRRLGVLEAGAAADLILVDHYPFTPISDDNTWGHLAFGVVPARVTHTMAAGRWLMKDGQLQTMDLPALAARSSKLAARLWARW